MRSVGIKKGIGKMKEQSREVNRKLKEQTITYLTTAFGFVAGLAWNEAIKALIDNFFPLGKNTVWAKLFYAVFVTLLVVLVTRSLLVFNKEEDSSKNKNKETDGEKSGKKKVSKKKAK